MIRSDLRARLPPNYDIVAVVLDELGPGVPQVVKDVRIGARRRMCDKIAKEEDKLKTAENNIKLREQKEENSRHLASIVLGPIEEIEALMNRYLSSCTAHQIS